MQSIAEQEIIKSRSNETLNRCANKLKFVWLELTEKCNLSCIHCYADSQPSKPLEAAMGKNDWKSVLVDARRLGCDRVQFIGGETLLVPYLQELLGTAKACGFSHVEIFSNVTLMRKEAISFLKEFDVHVATSFYSCNPAIHDHITQRRGSWKKTLLAIERLIDSGIPTRVGVIAVGPNNDHVKDTMDFLRGLGVSLVGSDTVRSIGRGSGLRSRVGYLNELCGRCGESAVCITNSGDIYPCIMARRTKLGNYLADGLEKAFTSEILETFRTALVEAKTIYQPYETLSSVACTPDCWPHGGCSPHDKCKPWDDVAPFSGADQQQL